MSVFPNQAKRKILVVAAQHAEACLRGVVRFGRSQDWHIVSDMLHTGAFPRGWRGDGIVALPGYNADLKHYLRAAGAPWVSVATTDEFLEGPSVTVDHAAIGERAAAFFLERLHRHFAVAPFIEDQAQSALFAGFTAGLALRGFAAAKLPPMHRRVGCYWHDDWMTYRKSLASELEKLPKPLALLAGNPSLAAEVVDACRELGLSVPQDVAVLSVGHATSDSTSLPLSYVPHDVEELAFHAASILAQIMEGQAVAAGPTRMAPKNIVAQASTEQGTPPSPHVVRALDYIANNYADPQLGVADVADAVGLSRRQLERSFRQETGLTINTHVVRYRMQEASRLLRAYPRSRVNEIGALVGFAASGSFHRTFRRHFGESPARHREDAVAEPARLDGETRVLESA